MTKARAIPSLLLLLLLMEEEEEEEDIRSVIRSGC